LDLVRAKSASEEKIDNYFTELSEIMKKYNLEDKPHLIFNVDEKDVSPNHTPPSIVAPTDIKVLSVTTGINYIMLIFYCVRIERHTCQPYRFTR
jgi:hypothetical protein